MTNNIIPFDRGAPPAMLAQLSLSLNQAAKAGVQESFAVVKIKGKNWSIRFRGETELVKGEDGLPMQRLPVVIVGVSPHISKQFYENGFTDESNSAPDCFSTNGQTPDPASPKKQCATCAACPKNVFGSIVSNDGRKGKACADKKRIAIVPAGDISNEINGGPMLLILPVTSLPNLKRYADMLERKGAPIQAVATGLTFDYNEAYPKVNFEALGWLDETQLIEVVGPDMKGGVCTHPLIERILQEPVDEVTHDANVPADGRANVLDQAPPPAMVTQLRQVQQEAPAPAQNVQATLNPNTASFAASAPAPATTTTVVQPAPADLASTIDALLAAPIKTA